MKVNAEEDLAFLEQVDYALQGKGLMGNAAFSKWVKKVSIPYCHEKPQCLLFLDFAGTYKFTKSIALSEQSNTELSVIPNDTLRSCSVWTLASWNRSRITTRSCARRPWLIIEVGRSRVCNSPLGCQWLEPV